jgi:hypothetical protein
MLSTFAMTTELGARLRTQQRVTAVALLLAAGSLAFAIWSRRNPPRELRFEEEGVETVVDAWGIRTRTADHASSATLEHTGLTLESGKAPGIPEYHASVQALYGLRQSGRDATVDVGNGSFAVKSKQGGLELGVFVHPGLTLIGNAGTLTLEPTHLAMSAGKLRADLLLNPSAKSASLDLESSADSHISTVTQSETSYVSVNRDLRHRAILSAGVHDEDPALHVKAELHERTYGAR